jgi:mycoredoxin-dependent peroxiredoxin
LKAYQSDIAKFDQSNTQVLGISVDSYAANKRFKEDIGVTFPLLSDFKRQVVKDYGIFDEENGFAGRATFTVDKRGSFATSSRARTRLIRRARTSRAARWAIESSAAPGRLRPVDGDSSVKQRVYES